MITRGNVLMYRSAFLQSRPTSLLFSDTTVGKIKHLECICRTTKMPKRTIQKSSVAVMLQ